MRFRASTARWASLYFSFVSLAACSGTAVVDVDDQPTRPSSGETSDEPQVPAGGSTTAGGEKPGGGSRDGGASVDAAVDGASADAGVPDDEGDGAAADAGDATLPDDAGPGDAGPVGPDAGVRESDYQIGDAFSKVPVTPEMLARETAAFQRAARATARVGGGTGFYLGRFAGTHLMATNHHVYSSTKVCDRPKTVRFTLLGVEATCTRVLGSWEAVDLAVFTVKFASPDDEAKVGPVAGSFAFGATLEQDTPLLTVGYGFERNRGGNAMANQDVDCRVLSRSGDYRYLADPDTVNPGPYKTWSFAMGCDVSHGDSGSSVVDRRTGAVLGLLWTAKVPTAPAIRTSKGVSALEARNGEDLWTEVSYAVPAPKIGEHLDGVIADPATGDDVRALLRALRAGPTP